MSKFILFFKKFALASLVLVLGLAAIPTSNASAADLKNQASPVQVPDNSRLEQAWVRIQTIYQHQGDRLAKAGDFINKTQSLIDKANQKGWDTSTLQSALDAFAAVIPAAQTTHTPGAAIIANHNGFDTSGKVTDRTTAIATVKALSQVNKDTRAAMNGTGQVLRTAIKAFRDAYKPAQVPNKP